jgi:hypothetical protein
MNTVQPLTAALHEWARLQNTRVFGSRHPQCVSTFLVPHNTLLANVSCLVDSFDLVYGSSSGRLYRDMTISRNQISRVGRSPCYIIRTLKLYIQCMKGLYTFLCTYIHILYTVHCAHICISRTSHLVSVHIHLFPCAAPVQRGSRPA